MHSSIPRMSKESMCSRVSRVVLATAFVLLVCGCARAPQERAWLSMATFASVSTARDDSGRVEEAGKLVKDEFDRLESIWSDYKGNSDISRLNRAAGESLQVSSDATLIVKRSCDYSRKTAGCFDATVGPLVDLWAIGSGRAFSIPDDKSIADARSLCGWEKVAIADNGAVKLGVSGMRFDPGGVGKGLAVDISSELLREAGLENHMVNLGGNIRCFGSSDRGDGWRIGVRDPFDQSKLLGALNLTDGMAVATSGNYEKYVEHDGKRYTHIIDPRTGRPVVGMASVTVVASSAADADALSTALFVAGIEEGAAILKAFPGAQAIFVTDTKPVVLHVTEGTLKLFEYDDDVAVEVIGELKKP